MGALLNPDLGQKMTPEEAKRYVDEVYNRMLARFDKRVTRGRYMQELEQGKLPMQGICVFWQNWHGFVAEINNLIGCTYQRHGWFFKRHLDLLPSFADKIADELINPKPPGHIQMVLEQGRIFGLSNAEMIDYQMLSECRALLEWHRGVLYEGTMIEWWASIAWEEAVGHWARQFRESIMAKYGFSKDQAPYFHTHEEADLTVHEGGILAHGDFNRAVTQRIIQDGLAYTRTGMTIEYTALMSVDLFALFLDGVYKQIHGIEW